MTLTAGDSPRAMSQEDVEIVTEFTRRFAAGRHVTDDYFAPEIVWDTSKSGMPAAGAITGREGVRRFFRDWLADWSDYEIEARDCIDAECAVLLVFRQAGTGKRGGREQPSRPPARKKGSDPSVTFASIAVRMRDPFTAESEANALLARRIDELRAEATSSANNRPCA
jgi:ketosteroid isomerase-like protein